MKSKSLIIAAIFSVFLIDSAFSAPRIIQEINLKPDKSLSHPVPITANLEDGSVFVAGIASGNILRFDPSSKAVLGEIKNIYYVWQMVVFDGKLYVSGLNSAKRPGVHIYDSKDLSYLGTIPSSNGWVFSFAIDALSATLYYGTWGKVYSVDLKDMSQKEVLSFPSWNHCVSCINIDKDLNKIYLTIYDYIAQSARAVSFDTLEENIISEVQLGKNPFPWDVRYDAAFDGENLFVTQMYRNEISVVNFTNSSCSNIPNVSWPQKLALDSNKGRLYVVDNYTDKFHVIDTKKLKVIKSFTPGDDPSGVFVDSVRGRVYTANYWSHDVAVIDSATESLSDKIIFSANSPLDLSVSDEKLYVSNGASGGIFVIDKNTYKPTEKIMPYLYQDAGLFTYAAGILNIFSGEIAEDGKNAYLIDKFNNSVAVFDLIQKKFLKHIAIPGNATTIKKSKDKIYFAWSDSAKLYLSSIENTEMGESFAVSADGVSYGIGINSKTNKAYIADHDNNKIVVFDMASKTIRNQIETADFPACVEVDEEANTVYVTNYGADCVSVIDGETDMLVGYIPVGEEPWGIALNPLTKRLYTVNTAEKTLSVVDLRNNALISNLPLGEGARYVKCDISAQRIYIPNQLSQSVTVVEDWVDVEPPENLTAEAVGTGDSVRLIWEPSPSASKAGYLIYRSIAQNQILIARTTNLVFVDEEVLEGEKYVYSVSAVDTSGNESEKISVEITPTVVPLPPKNLSANVEGSKVLLAWEHSPSEDTSLYNIYFDNKTGKIDYLTPIASVKSDINTWITDTLPNGTYIFAVRACDKSNNEEKNTDVTATAIVDVRGKARATIKIPQDGKRLSGNAVTVMAEATDTTVGVLFQYRPVGGSWTDISAMDTKFPYSVYWNLSALPNGEYNLAAVAYDKDNLPDTSPPFITVYIDDVNPDIVEDGNPSVDPNNPARVDSHTKQEKLKDVSDAEVSLGDGTKAIFKAGSFVGEKTLVMRVISKEEINARALLPPVESSLKSAGIFREFYFSDGTREFSKSVTLAIPYPDENRDGVVDGTDIRASELRVFYFDENTKKWEPVNSGVSISPPKVISVASGKSEMTGTIRVDVNHFTVFGLFAQKAPADLTGMIVYPNPYIPKDGNPLTGTEKDGIKFDGLTPYAKIQIFTITGKIVWQGESENTGGSMTWNAKNSEGDDVASGVYIYLVTNDKGQKQKGKIAIIR